MNIIKAANDLNYSISEVKDDARKRELEHLMKEIENVLTYPDDMPRVEIECLATHNYEQYGIISMEPPFKALTEETFDTLKTAIDYCSEQGWYAERY